MEGHGKSFPITILTFQVRKVMGGGWTLDFEFGTCIWDLDLGLGFGTGLGLDNTFISKLHKGDKGGRRASL